MLFLEEGHGEHFGLSCMFEHEEQNVQETVVIEKQHEHTKVRS